MDADQLCLWCEDRGCGVCGRETSNVIDLFERIPVRREGKWDLEIGSTIACLEDLIERAHAGEFTGICAVLDGPTGTSVAMSAGALEDPLPYLGGLSRVGHRLNTELDYDED